MNKEIDITGVILKTKRLVLRPFSVGDLNDFYEYAKVDGVGRPAGWNPHENIEESKRVLNGFIENKKTFAIVYKGKVIGSVGVEMYDEYKNRDLKELCGRELGFVLSKDYWGRGIMTEAVKRVIKYLFEEVKLDFILCAHMIGNTRSMRVQQKCGFKYVNDRYYYMSSYGKRKKCRSYILTKEDYFSSKPEYKTFGFFRRLFKRRTD